MNLQTEFPTAVAHYTRLAQQKGWYAYTRQRVHELDEEPSGLFKGIHAAVAANVAAYAVPQDEKGKWWLIKSEAQRGRA